MSSVWPRCSSARRCGATSKASATQTWLRRKTRRRTGSRLSTFSTTVRGAPEGKYVTVVYLTKFAHAPLVNETILVKLEDSHWRIAGYSIDRAPEPPAPPAPEEKPAPSGGAKPKG
ncbi:MAG: DUF4019 domain-containing protein [Betaproteobacteria bacterium]|nr:MAG: DUF4019 domain-containing protein [Betaproteobacteria bacterium]